ncbi:DUF6458 family protein [Streptomyces sp. NBC_00006]|uniref:DUF6458 family protein n=1 Tax=unclassified Streptomyces TaxID=2593676 RepID=UPI00224FA079|nr:MULTISPECIES: DUF6458 family protein [unclassified Streptomyces]MCX5532603.1 DUF6458 family protein [Streptomyces sp. NBC_00006]
MNLGGSIVLIAVGAILAFATDWHMESVNLDLVGWILMIVGLIGVFVFRSIGKRRGLVPPANHTTVIEDERDRHI